MILSILLVSLAAVLFVIWAVWRAYIHEPFDVDITYHEVCSPDLPAYLDGFTICQVSDLHITSTGRNAKEIAAAIRSVRADLFVLTGDMILRQDGIDAFFRWFDALGDAIRPAVAIRGNAEHKSYVNRTQVLDGFAA